MQQVLAHHRVLGIDLEAGEASVKPDHEHEREHRAHDDRGANELADVPLTAQIEHLGQDVGLEHERERHHEAADKHREKVEVQRTAGVEGLRVLIADRPKVRHRIAAEILEPLGEQEHSDA